MTDAPPILKGSVKEVLARWDALPNADATADQVAQRFDVGEFHRTRPLRDVLAKIIDYVRPFADGSNAIRIDEMPAAIQAQIFKDLDQVSETLGQIHGYCAIADTNVVPPRFNPGAIQSNAAVMKEVHGRLYQNLEKIRSSSLDEIRNVKAEFDSERQAIRAELEKLQSAKVGAQQTSENLKEAAERAAVFVLSQQELGEIEQIISDHKKSAKRWLIFLSLIGVFAGLLLFWLMIPDQQFLFWFGPVAHHYANSEGWHHAASVIQRTVIVSFFVAILLAAFRVYQNHVNAIVVNRQRRLALVTFGKLYEALGSADAAARTEIVKQAAQTIFGQNSTGFLGKHSSELKFPNAIASSLLRSKLLD